MNTTQEQKEILLEWMKQHPDVARGRLRRKGESKHQMTWKDWKMNVLKKETKRRNNGMKTGGGSPKNVNFSSLEENLLEFLTPEAAGLLNIPEGGIYLSNNNQGKFFGHPVYTHMCIHIYTATEKLLNFQERKLKLKKEEVAVQKEILEVHKGILVELQKIRNVLELSK
ncbi:hypothetical protein PUN28_016885 [Cardiocondyla obscurior]|uniref:Uncharacterized protein n=1 Tax=Cardiocondyla obscurior TaxID=286306 RepID=A0AAW2ET13_9HYME